MECSTLDHDFPFVARKEQLIDKNTGLDTTFTGGLMFLNWFLGISKHNKKVRLCPDILYLTHETEEGTLFLLT